jgi:hypothetical protein
MNFTDRINHARETLIDATDPDGIDMWQALLLADRAGTVADYAVDPVSWDFYSLAMGEAIEHLDSPVATWTLPVDIRPTVDDLDRLAGPVCALVQRLADVFAGAAEGHNGSPWRRLVWAQIAHRLDDARKAMS